MYILTCRYFFSAEVTIGGRLWLVALPTLKDVVQCRHATIWLGKSVFFSVKICINPYRCIAKTFTRFISNAVCKKIATRVTKSDSQQQRTKIGALLHVARQSDWVYPSDCLAQSCSTGDEISGLSEI